MKTLVSKAHEEFCRLFSVIDQECTRHGVQLDPDDGVMPARWANAGDEMQLTLAWIALESQQ